MTQPPTVHAMHHSTTSPPNEIAQPYGGDDVAALVCIIRAARLAGDRTLERSTRRALESDHGIRLTFSVRRQEAAR